MAVALLGDMKDFDRKMDGATKKVSTFDKTVGKMSASVTKYAKAAALAATAAVVAFGVSAVKTFVEFDTGMREVFTLMPELSTQARQEMTKDVKALSKEIAVLPTKVIPALYQAISAGIPKENVFEFMEIAGKAAIGGVTELEVAVDGLTTVVNAYGSEVISAQEAADIMFTTVKEGKTTFDELAARLFQAAPLAAKLGLEFHNVAAAAAQITLSGVPMRVGMTQIRSLLNEVAFEGKELNKVFVEAAGMSFPAYLEAGGDIADIVEILQGAADKAGISIAELTTNIQAQQGLLNLSGVSLGNLREILDEMANSAGAADAAYEEMATGIQFQLNELAVWWETLRVDIGKDLTENLKDLLYWLEENREGIGSAIKSIFDGLIAGLEWLQRNASAVKSALITIAIGFAAVRFAIDPLSASIGLLTGGIALFIIGVESSAKEMLNAEVAAAALKDGLDKVANKTSELDLALASLSLSLSIIPGLVGDAEKTVSIYINAVSTAAAELLNVGQLSEDTYKAIVAGLIRIGEEMKDVPVGEAAIEAKIAILALLEALAENDEGAQKLINTWLGLSETAETVGDEIEDTTKDIEDMVAAFTTVEIEAAEKALEDLRAELDNTEKGSLDYIVVVEKIRSEYAKLIAAEEAVIGQSKDVSVRLLELIALYEKLGITLEDSTDDVKVWGETYRDIVSSTVADMLWDFATFHRKTEDAEEDHQRRMQDIIEEGFKDMANAIIQSGLDKAAEWAIDQIWNIAFESELAAESANTALAGIGAGISLSPALAFLAPLAYGQTDPAKTHQFGQQLDESIRELISLIPFFDIRNAEVAPSYALGGVVPGPIGAPQMAIVHGGEEVLTPEERAAGALDYELMGEAVYAGTYDAMAEIAGEKRSTGSAPDLLTRLAQALYEPLQAEDERRGGTL